MEAKLYGQNKGGMSINGFIKDYYAYAGEKISAGDLVEYVNGVAGKVDYGESVDTQLSTGDYSATTSKSMSAVQLDENRVFVAHRYTASGYLYAMVVTISGATITVGTDTELKSSKGDGYVISACLLPNGNVFVAHSNTTDQELYAIVCSIDGTTITKGSNTALYTTVRYGQNISTCSLPNGNVFVAYGGTIDGAAGAGTTHAMVCSINGTTITAGTDVAITSASYSGHGVSACLLPNGNVFVAHGYSQSRYLYGVVVQINGTTITAGTDTKLVETSHAGYTISTCLLPNGKVFIAHSIGTGYTLNGIVVSIDGTTIMAGNDTTISSTSYTGYTLSTCLLPNGSVLILHGNQMDSASLLYGIICTADGTNITCGADTQLSDIGGTGYGISSLLLTDGNIFVTHSNALGVANTNYLYAQIFGVDYENNIPTNNVAVAEYETQVRKVTTGQFDGIAKTSGTGGDNTGHKDLVSIWTGVTYTPVSYIESTKTQWIDTNYFVKYGDVVTFDMAFLDTQSYLGYYSSNTNRFGLGVAKGAFEIVNGSNTSVYKPVSDTERHTFVIDTTGQIKFDDTAQSVTAMATDFEAAFSIGLFGRKQTATSTSFRGQHRVYRFAVERGSELIMNLIPCRRDSDGVLGLRDEVTGKFYTNAGTGTFTAG